MKLNLKHFLLSSAAITTNSLLMFQAIQENKKYNQYLRELPEGEKEKLNARNWYLRRHGLFFNSEHPLLRRWDIDAYNQKSEHEKDQILIRYRWSQLPER